ncbi:hypothetical protein [Sphingosinicella sp. CPCC 101087]|uniref:hypothetical protein n=1 Tax=Sphingosinicella sp. CPCC 101087 TaxID=2497754 RepID=UPI00101CC415|nr:hypothetical protein [Sphingosinicella sp. CPCC 101087]
MRKLTLALCAAAAGTCFLSTPVPAQNRGEVILFSQIGFRGQTFVISGERQTVRVPWAVRSARVASGEQWELCSRTRFRGPCNRLSRNVANVRWAVASARPTAIMLPEPGGGESLRGMSAEFFPRPSDGRGRVISCASGAAACAADSARAFCRSRGWNGAGYHRQETVGGRNFLADLLCTRAAF